MTSHLHHVTIRCHIEELRGDHLSGRQRPLVADGAKDGVGPLELLNESDKDDDDSRDQERL
jgi:hypothetical protein